MPMDLLSWECFHLREKFCPMTTPAILPAGEWSVVSKREGGVSRGATIQVKLLSSNPGAAGLRCRPFSCPLFCVVGGGSADRLQEVMVPVVDHKICSQQDWWGSQAKDTMICAGGDGVRAGCSVRAFIIRGFSSCPLSFFFLFHLAVPSVLVLPFLHLQ